MNIKKLKEHLNNTPLDVLQKEWNELVANQEDLDPEFSRVVDKHFWDLFDNQEQIPDDFQGALNELANKANPTPSKERFTEEVDLSKPLPCPFCGSESRIREINGPFDDHALYYDIGCIDDECYLSEGTDWCFDTKEEAIKKWNRRK